MRVLVTGGAGYIGSHAVRALLDKGHEVSVLDNLGKGHKEAVDSRAQFYEGNMADVAVVTKILQDKKIEALMHFAADIEVGESVSDPFKYYENNFSKTLILLKTLVENNVKKVVFSSTAAVYGNPVKTPIEEHQLRAPINPYGRSKMFSEMAIEDFSHAHGLGYVILRYFNVAGAHPDGKTGEDHHPESHLIPRILKSAQENASVKIFGTDYPTPDGTCIRDYVHVVDLASAHVLALEKMQIGVGKIFNLGSQNGFSVRDIIKACEKVTGKKLVVEEVARRPGDPAVLIASSENIRRELGWTPQFEQIETVVQHAWNWHQTHPHGYVKL